MTEIHEHKSEQFYDEEDRLFSVSIDIDGETTRGDADDCLLAVKRLREAVRREAQAIQDELDTEDEIDGDG